MAPFFCCCFFIEGIDVIEGIDLIDSVDGGEMIEGLFG